MLYLQVESGLVSMDFEYPQHVQAGSNIKSCLIYKSILMWAGRIIVAWDKFSFEFDRQISCTKNCEIIDLQI